MGVLKKNAKNDTLNIRIRSEKKQKVQEILKQQNKTLTEVLTAKINELINDN